MNEESVIHMRSEEVVARLCSLDEARETIRLVVAHSEREGESQAVQEVIPEVMDVSETAAVVFQLTNFSCSVCLSWAVVR